MSKQVKYCRLDLAAEYLKLVAYIVDAVPHKLSDQGQLR